MNKIRVAFVGLSHVHVTTLYRDFAKFPDRYEFVGMADVPPYTSEELEKKIKLNVPEECTMELYDDYRELLGKDIHLAVVNTDIKGHGDIVPEILEMGIHVVAEKPMAVDMADALKMYEAYKNSSAELIINWPVAWFPAFRKVKELADSGAVGKVHRVHYRSPATTGPYSLTEYTPEQLTDMWWYQSERGGGSIYDYAGYGCVLSTWIIGKQAQRVAGFKKNFNLQFSDVEDYSVFTLDFGDSVGFLEGSWSTINNGEIPTGPVVYGSEGTIVGDRFSMQVKVYNKYTPYVPSPAPDMVYDISPIQDSIALNVADFIQKGTPLHEVVTAEFNLRAMAALDAGIRSCKSGNIENCIANQQ